VEGRELPAAFAAGLAVLRPHGFESQLFAAAGTKGPHCGVELVAKVTANGAELGLTIRARRARLFHDRATVGARERPSFARSIDALGLPFRRQGHKTNLNARDFMQRRKSPTKPGTVRMDREFFGPASLEGPKNSLAYAQICLPVVFLSIHPSELGCKPGRREGGRVWLIEAERPRRGSLSSPFRESAASHEPTSDRKENAT
jgi:hypothetical protein